MISRILELISKTFFFTSDRSRGFLSVHIRTIVHSKERIADMLDKKVMDIEASKAYLDHQIFGMG